MENKTFEALLLEAAEFILEAATKEANKNRDLAVWALGDDALVPASKYWIDEYAQRLYIELEQRAARMDIWRKQPRTLETEEA